MYDSFEWLLVTVNSSTWERVARVRSVPSLHFIVDASRMRPTPVRAQVIPHAFFLRAQPCLPLTLSQHRCSDSVHTTSCKWIPGRPGYQIQGPHTFKMIWTLSSPHKTLPKSPPSSSDSVPWLQGHRPSHIHSMVTLSVRRAKVSLSSHGTPTASSGGVQATSFVLFLSTRPSLQHAGLGWATRSQSRSSHHRRHHHHLPLVNNRKSPPQIHL